MKLTFVNVGYGEAILLECPDPAYKNGKFVMLIDGGSARADEFKDTSSGRIPLVDYVRSSHLDHIDVMVSTHIHEDHICGMLPVAKHLLPGELWQTFSVKLSGEMHTLKPASARNLSQENFMRALNDYQALCSIMAEHHRPIRTLHAGACGTLCEGLTYQVLAPPSAQIAGLEKDFLHLYRENGETFFETLDQLDRSMNNSSLMLLLEYHGTRLLLPGDTNAGGYSGIDPAALRAHLFKVGHHGQKDGVDQPLTDKVKPTIAVCCVSSDRRYDSAHPDVIELLRQNGIDLYFSDCPKTAGQEIPPHHAVIFTVGSNGALTAEYTI